MLPKPPAMEILEIEEKEAFGMLIFPVPLSLSIGKQRDRDMKL
jgi:hypothetical protein